MTPAVSNIRRKGEEINSWEIITFLLQILYDFKHLQQSSGVLNEYGYN